MNAESGGIPRRPYKNGVELSVVGFGGIVVIGMEQPDADAIVAEAVEGGVNYFDVAPDYGDGEAEEKLGPALEPFREAVFLACKTSRRDAEGAAEDLERSLRRLRTERLDLYQFHAVKSHEQVQRILGPGGAAETFVRAREQGKVRYLGFSAHTEEAALLLMDVMEFASVLFPVNYVCWTQGRFGPRVLARAEERDMARLAIKSLAYTPWKKNEERKYPKCWYRPVDEPEMVERALRFTLSRGVASAVSPSHASLLRAAIAAAPVAARRMTEEEERILLASASGVTPVFSA